MLTALQIESICDYADGLRAKGQGWEGIVAPLVEGGLKISVGEVQAWHRKWQRKKAGEECYGYEADAAAVEALPAPEVVLVEDVERQRQEERDVFEEAAEMIEKERMSALMTEKMAEALRYIGRELVEEISSWQYACTRVVEPGQTVERVKGPGSRGGVEWKKAAVILWEGAVGAGQVVEVFPEHRVQSSVPAKPPHYMTPAVRLQVWSLGDARAVRLSERLLSVEVKLKAIPTKHRAIRTRLEKQRARLLEQIEAQKQDKKSGRAAGGVSVMKVTSIVSRLATVMDLYGIGGTAEDGTGGNGAALGRATGRTRAQQSWQRLKLQEEDTRRTGGRAGFAGLRKPRTERKVLKHVVAEAGRGTTKDMKDTKMGDEGMGAGRCENVQR